MNLNAIMGVYCSRYEALSPALPAELTGTTALSPAPRHERAQKQPERVDTFIINIVIN